MSIWQRIGAFVFRVRGVVARRRHEREVDQELEMHLGLLANQYVRAGMSPADARRAARAKLAG